MRDDAQRARAGASASGNSIARPAAAAKTSLVPSISAPTGGGAIRGVGEKFTANPATGSGSMTIPLPISPGRAGFGPELSLAYDSSAGNGPFGFGWSLSLPRITRKTELGLPRYLDAEESDVFVLSGSEDLVPVLLPDGTRYSDTSTEPGFTIHRYRPRVEGLFARIERWTHTASGDVHWRSISRDNVTTLYGQDASSRVVNPNSVGTQQQIFEWLICASYDDKGNALTCEYVQEDAAGVDVARASERNRVRGAVRYLKRVRYGNRVSRLIQPDLSLASWLFELVFDYGEGHYVPLALDPSLAVDEQHRFVHASFTASGTWPERPDPFSSCRPGFELRTHRRCQRVLMFHRFDELGPEPCLVQSLQFEYDDLELTGAARVEAELAHPGSTRLGSFIQRIVLTGHVREPAIPVVVDGAARYLTYLTHCRPPLEFEYSKAQISSEVRQLDAESLANLPAGVDGGDYQWADLDAEGIAGVVVRTLGAWYYKPNLGEGQFGAVQLLRTEPSLFAQDATAERLMDLRGDGQLDVVRLSGPNPGFYERTSDGGWQPFRAFLELPNVNWSDPNLRLVDLDGDGRADVLISESDVFTWYQSKGEDGFGRARRVAQATNEERGPRLVFADAEQSIYLADMSGDGLSDLVRIRNREVCYWPNLGYGRFGAKLAMDNTPSFDHPDQFDHKRVLLADIDGSGTTDVVYLHGAGARVYFNQSGNRLSSALPLPQVPPVDTLSGVTTLDLLGNGTCCLLWSSRAPASGGHPLSYVDLMGGQKPHLLIRSRNNLGAETRLQYASSTKFYLADKRAGKPWITRLPFPVHVVERVETIDLVSNNRFVTRYSYHHGHFDGVEREFRGFGLVQQLDTEQLASLSSDQELPGADNLDEASHVPPRLTKSWFHTGVYLGRNRVSNYFAGLLDARDTGEYFREPGLSELEVRALLLEDTPLPAGLSLEEEREACRALRGALLRQEVFALDGADRAALPYSVSERNYGLRLLQARGSNRNAVLLRHDAEQLDYGYERTLVPVLGGVIVDRAVAAVDPSVQWQLDPRLTHLLTLEVDNFGSVRKAAKVAYGRRYSQPDLEQAVRDEQGHTLVTLTENRTTNGISSRLAHRLPQVYDARSYELTGYAPSGPAGRYQPTDFVTPSLATPGTKETLFDRELSFEQTPSTGRERRLIQHMRTLFRRDDLVAALPLGQLESLGLSFESYKLALTPGLILQVYNENGAVTRVTDAMLEGTAATPGGRYVHTRDENGIADTAWWIPSGRAFFSPDPADTPGLELQYAQSHFFLPHRGRDPFHSALATTEHFVRYDDYVLLVLETVDPLGNRTTVGERNVNPSQPLVVVGQDYRVLQPALIMDQNRNRTSFAFDALGMLAGTALMGKPEEGALGDNLSGFRPDVTQAELDAFVAAPKGPLALQLLAQASTRIINDTTAFWRAATLTHKPAIFAASLTRETHASDAVPETSVRVRVSFSYSDGFGREIQKKLQAEGGRVPLRDADGAILVGADNQPIFGPTDVDPRWVGTGWTVFDNKGNPVRRYEPFFSDTHRFEVDARIGTSPIVFYDPTARVIATLHPNHTWEKVVFEPWAQANWDASDNVLVTAPDTDPDVGDYFARLPASNYSPSWHERRRQGALGPDEQTAARKSELYAATPTLAHFDALGRTICTVTHNRFKYSNAPISSAPQEQLLTTRVAFDIIGNQRQVFDAKNRSVVQHQFDAVGTRIHQSSMEGGARWTLVDVTTKPLYAWDSRGHRFRSTYDQLQRLVESLLLDPSGELSIERRTYGEANLNPELHNLRGKLYALFDQAGVTTNDEYDFKGNLTRTSRQLAASVQRNGQPEPAYRHTLDWSASITLRAEKYVSRMRYDALNRRTQGIAPHSDQPGARIHVIQPTYNAANLLERLDVWLDVGAEPTALLDPDSSAPSAVGISNIDYDAKAQRLRVDYKNGVTTRFDYEPETLRLSRLQTADGLGRMLQDLRYTYDAAGNVTRVHDASQQAVYFSQARVDATSEYTYDALFQLLEATGREHLGQLSNPPTPHSYNDASRTGSIGIPHPNDGQALGRYIERYFYDEVGNITALRHAGTNPGHPGWSRTYTYAEQSQLEPAALCNRLTQTVVGNGGLISETYSNAGDGYDAHGNMLKMPQLHSLQWNERDQLRMTQRQAVNTSDADGVAHQGERTWYVYDAEGRRILKVTELASGALKESRLYLEGFEIHQRAGGTTFVRETLRLAHGEQVVALVESRVQGSEPGVPARLVRYQHGNHLGSVCLELDEQARVLTYEEYTPFGSTAYQSQRSAGQAPKRYRASALERDEESGLSYRSARYYAPWLGRWTSADPLSLVDGANLYRFCRNRPSMLDDKNGCDPDKVDLGPLRLQRPSLTANGSASFQLQLNDLFSSNRSITITGASIAGSARLSADASLPAFSLSGRAFGNLTLDAMLIDSQLRASLSGRARFDIGPAELGVSFNLRGSTRVPSRLPLSSDAFDIARDAALANLRGNLELRADLDLGPLRVASASLSSNVGAGGVGTLHLDGRLRLPLTYGRVTGTGSISPSGYSIDGSFRAVTPIGGGFGNFSLSSDTGFSARGHYFGAQFGPLGLAPDIQNLAEGITAARRSRNPYELTSFFNPGTSIGYSFFNLSPSGSQIFSVGFAPTPSIVDYSDAQKPLPFPASFLEPTLYGRSTSRPAGVYGGASLSLSF